MWFKRLNRNRRRSPGQQLDVKVRADQLRNDRHRFAAKTILAGLGTVFGLYILWRAGEWNLDKFVYDNPAFAIEQVEVQTDGVIAQDQLRRWSGVTPGANLIALDLAGVKRNLELVSSLDTVSIERILPRTLKIRVTERRPVAQVNLLRTLPSGEVAVAVFQLDEAGYVLQPLDSRRSVLPLDSLPSELPGITGLALCELQPGHPVKSPQALAALHLIVAFKHSPMAGQVAMASVDVSAPGVLVAATGQGSQVTLALDHLDQQLRRWRAIYDWGHTVGREIGSLDLAVGNNIPVKWAEAGNPVMELPKSAKPLHNRRNNV